MYDLPVLTADQIETIGCDKRIIQDGNDKTGPKTIIHNRAVGYTCNKTCPFLDGGCYGQKGNCVYENVKQSKINSTYASKSAIFEARMEAELNLAKIKGKVAFRMHETGDFIDPYTGKIDYEYIRIMVRVISKVKIPTWVYTHIDLPKRIIARMEKVGIKVFRSLHENLSTGPHGINKIDSHNRCAVVSETNIKSWDKKKKVVKISGKAFKVCPHQLGDVKDCGTCGLCFKGIKNVYFLKH